MSEMRWDDSPRKQLCSAVTARDPVENRMSPVNSNGVVLPSNGLSEPNTIATSGVLSAATQGMLRGLMSQFASKSVGVGLFAGVPNFGVTVGHIRVPSGTGQMPLKRAADAAEKERGCASWKQLNENEQDEGLKGWGKHQHQGPESLSRKDQNSPRDRYTEDASCDDGDMDIKTSWRCEVCDIYFASVQALGGHRNNSTDHKQRLERLRRGGMSFTPCLSPSLHVNPNEETADLQGKRTRLPPMAEMAGFESVLRSFPPDVLVAFLHRSEKPGPSSYFATCNLDVFKQHAQFGALGALIIDKYFTAETDVFEEMMLNPAAIPEVEQAGFSRDMPDHVHSELKAFYRMLLLKKKGLDVNRRAVSKRIKGQRRKPLEDGHETACTAPSHATHAPDTPRTRQSPPGLVSVPAPAPKVSPGMQNVQIMDGVVLIPSGTRRMPVTRRAANAAEKERGGAGWIGWEQRNANEQGEGRKGWRSHSTEDAGYDDGDMDINLKTSWRCEVCDIYFASAQALGGHRINSTDHKQRRERLRGGGTAALPGTPRLSLHVVSNERPAALPVKGKRKRLPPMAGMAGFESVLSSFRADVQLALLQSSGAASYFSTCNLDVFRQHETFGALGALIIDKYFTAETDVFEEMMLNPAAIPEVEQAGFSRDMPDHVHSELKAFYRMLLTKKKFLDVNRRAVSKRIKGIRQAGGDRLRDFNHKKARHAVLPPRAAAVASGRMTVAVPLPTPHELPGMLVGRA